MTKTHEAASSPPAIPKTPQRALPVLIAGAVALAAITSVSAYAFLHSKDERQPQADAATPPPVAAGPPAPMPDWVKFTALTFSDPATGQTSLSLRYQNTRQASAEFTVEDWQTVTVSYFASLVDASCRMSKTVRAGEFANVDELCLGASRRLTGLPDAPSRDQICGTTPTALAEVEANRDVLRDVSNTRFFAVGVAAPTVQAINAAVCTGDIDGVVDATERVASFVVIWGLRNQPDAQTADGRTALAGTANAIWAEKRLSFLTSAIEGRAKSRGLME